MQAEELRESLELNLSRHYGARRSIKQFRHRRSVYSSSAVIENIDLELDRGLRLRLVLKDLSPASLLPTARAVRPDFLYSPSREIETYRKILQPQQWGTATYYGSFESHEQARHWLFLERVNGSLLWQMGRLATWEEAARWLGRFHVEFETRVGKSNQSQFSHLPKHDSQFFLLWLTRAEEFLRHRNLNVSSESLRRFGRLADRYSHVIQRLQDLPVTLIHGEYYPSNVIVRPARQGERICPIDWEVSAIGPALIDLAALTSGDWSEAERRKMAGAYQEVVGAAGSWPSSMNDLMEAVELCQLYLAMRWLGWAADWSPPEMHAQNWLGVACQLADKLGL